MCCGWWVGWFNIGHGRCAVCTGLTARGGGSLHLDQPALVYLCIPGIPSPTQHACGCLYLQGMHDEQDKLAPEWDAILRQLQAAAPALERLGSQAREQQRRAQPWANATQAIAAGVAELSGPLPVATRWDDKSGQLLVGAHVHFPGLVAPRAVAAAAGRLAAATAEGAAVNRSTVAGSSAEGSAIRRARRITLQRAAQDAGAAAVADWAPLLEQRFGARLQRGGPDSAVLLAPAGQVDAALQWLARRPAVHWVAPAPRLRLNNKRVTVIAQVRGGFPGCCWAAVPGARRRRHVAPRALCALQALPRRRGGAIPPRLRRTSNSPRSALHASPAVRHAPQRGRGAAGPHLPPAVGGGHHWSQPGRRLRRQRRG